MHWAFCITKHDDMLKGKKIVLGITGSIAAYKSCLIIRELINRIFQGWDSSPHIVGEALAGAFSNTQERKKVTKDFFFACVARKERDTDDIEETCLGRLLRL